MKTKLKELFAAATVTAGVTTVVQAVSFSNSKKQKQEELRNALKQLREDNQSYLENVTETNKLLTEIKGLLTHNEDLKTQEILEVVGNLKITSNPNLLDTPNNIASTSETVTDNVTNNFKPVADSQIAPELYAVLEKYLNNDTIEFYNYAGFSVLMSTCLLFLCFSSYLFNNYLKDKLDNLELRENKKSHRFLLRVIHYYKLGINLENYVLLTGLLISTLLLLVVGLCLLLA